jgi:hypothetical protein
MPLLVLLLALPALLAVVRTHLPYRAEPSVWVRPTVYPPYCYWTQEASVLSAPARVVEGSELSVWRRGEGWVLWHPV